MVTSYTVLKDRIQIFCDNHYQIEKFGGEFPSEINNFATKDERYPILYLSPINQRVYENVTEFDLDIYVLDLIDDDRSNINVILSDTNLILNDLYNYYKEGYDDAIDVIGNPSLSPLNNQLLDYAAGWVIRITLEVNNYTACQIPFIDGIPYVSSDNCQTNTYKYLTCETVTGCTSLQEYIAEQIAAIPSGTTVTGFTFNPGNYQLELDQSNDNNFSVDLSILASDMTITGGTYNSSTGTATFTNNSGGTFDVTGFLTGFTDIYTTGATYDVSTGEATFTRNDGNSYSVSGFYTGGTDTYITGFTNNNNVFTISDNTGQDFSTTLDTLTGLTINGILSATTISATTYNGDGSNLTGVYPSTNPSGFTSNVGTVTSVGLSMPPAFTVTNSPVISAGTLTVAGAGLTSQYVRGDGSLANFPASTGGGASLSFYLNGSVSQGTFGGISFREMDRTPILGAGTDFTINANGYIQSFITDAGVPNLLEIPAGNWNFETYFSASSGGGSPSFYVELYKWDGTTLSLIASNSANPEGITNGTVTDLYVSALAVPQTTLLATDRLAVRIYVNHSSKTIKLHTENGHLCQVITTFSTGITALNGLTTQVQNFSVGTTGTDFGINSTSATHTFNLPTASATNRGALSSTDWTTFNNKLSATITSPTGGDTLQYNGTTAIWENSKPFWTVDLMDNSSVEFYAVQDTKINSITNIVGSPTITIADDGAPYTLTNTILSGSKITVTTNTPTVIKLNITY
jgi:hypothetical protein